MTQIGLCLGARSGQERHAAMSDLYHSLPRGCGATKCTVTNKVRLKGRNKFTRRILSSAMRCDDVSSLSTFNRKYHVRCRDSRTDSGQHQWSSSRAGRGEEHGIDPRSECKFGCLFHSSRRMSMTSSPNEVELNEGAPHESKIPGF